MSGTHRVWGGGASVATEPDATGGRFSPAPKPDVVALAVLGAIAWVTFDYGGDTSSARRGLAFAAAVLIASLILGPRGRLRGAAHAPLTAPLAALAVWGVVQLASPAPFGTIDAFSTARGLGLLCAMLVVHGAASVAAGERASAGRIEQGLVGLGLVLALAGLAARMPAGPRPWLHPEDPMNPEFGPFAYRNHYAAWLILVLPLALGRFSAALGALWASPRRSLLASVAEGSGFVVLRRALPPLAMLLALFATTSRAPVISLVVALGLVALFRRRQSARALLAVGLPLLLALGFLWPSGLVERMGSASRDIAGRLAGWEAAAALFRERPMAGWGLNAYPAAVETLGQRRAELMAIHPHLAIAAHNDYLEIAAEAGAPGLALVVWAGVRALRASRHQPWRQVALAAGLGHASVDFDMDQPALAVLFAAIAAPGPDEATGEPSA